MAPVQRRFAIPRDLTSKPTPEYLQDFYEHVAGYWRPFPDLVTRIEKAAWKGNGR